MKPTITIEDVSKLDLRIATITAAEEVPGADKLLKLTLDAGDLGTRTIASGIKPWYSVEQLVGKQVIYLANLEPRMFRGVESQGMLLAAGTTEAVLLHPDKPVAPGAALR